MQPLLLVSKYSKTLCKFTLEFEIAVINFLKISSSLLLKLFDSIEFEFSFFNNNRMSIFSSFSQFNS